MICSNCEREVRAELTEFDGISEIFNQATAGDKWQNVHSIEATVTVKCTCGHVEIEFEDGSSGYIADFPDGWIYS